MDTQQLFYERVLDMWLGTIQRRDGSENVALKSVLPVFIAIIPTDILYQK